MSIDEVNKIRESFQVSLKDYVRNAIPSHYRGMLELVDDHMGWSTKKKGQETRGKRIRPLLVLLSTAAAGGNWEIALPAAWSVELIHNFSLIHDDIQDKSELRHGQPTIWVKWGIAQAINTGDLLFNLAFEGLSHLESTLPAKTALEGVKILSQACTRLTGGQFLDLSYENRNDITIEDYLPMVSGKTATLMAACTELGALCAEAKDTVRTNFYNFGFNLGLAFQAWDDWLGIWGDALLTGKSNQSDLLTGKKTLPVLFGLSQNQHFAQRWRQGPISTNEVKFLSELLIQEGAQDFTQKQVEDYTRAAYASLQLAAVSPRSMHLLIEFSKSLLNRKN